MKRLIAFTFYFLLFTFYLSAQTIVDPETFTEQTVLDGNDLWLFSKRGGTGTWRKISEATLRQYVITGLPDSLEVFVVQDSIITLRWNGSEISRDSLPLSLYGGGGGSGTTNTGHEQAGTPGTTVEGDIWIKTGTDSSFIYDGGWKLLAIRAKLTETEVDAFVANNGYLTSEMDGSTTNELTEFTASASAPGSPKQGDLWHDTDGDTLFVYDNGGWVFAAIRAGTDNQTASEVNITDAGGFYTGSTVEAALQEIGDSIALHRTDIDAIAAGAADGVATAGTWDDANNEIDVTVAAPGSNFSINLQGIMDSINAISGGGTPGGSDTQLQYNNSGSFGGISGATTDGSIVTLATPVFTTSAQTPLIIGGTGTTSSLTYRTTTGVGATGARHIFQVGNNGATEAMTILNSGNVGIGTNSPTHLLTVSMPAAGNEEVARFKVSDSNSYFSVQNNTSSAGTFTPTFYGYEAAANNSITIIGAAETDSGVNPVIEFQARQQAGATIATRPLFRFRNFSTQVAIVDKDGNWKFGSGNPNEKIDVTGNARVSGQYQIAGTDQYFTVSGGTLYAVNATGNWAINVGGGSDEMNVSTTGLSVGTTAHANKLDVEGGAAIGATYSGTSAAPSNGLLVEGSVGIGTSAPTNTVSLGGDSNRTIWMERRTTADAAGNNLTVQAGGATSGATNKAGGNLTLYSGAGTGTAGGAGGGSNIVFGTYTPGTSGTSDNTLSTKMVIYNTGRIGMGTATPDASAIVDISSTTGGLLMPRMTAAQAGAIGSPANGLVVYVTDTDGTFTSVGFWGREGGAWVKL